MGHPISFQAMQQAEEDKKFLWAWHKRAPDWLMGDRAWGASPAFRLIRLDNFSMKEQISMMAAASGLISIEGAAFAHQMFMPLMSKLLVMHVPRGGTCEVQEWHAAVAQYLGHYTLEWRVCRQVGTEVILQVKTRFLSARHKNERRFVHEVCETARAWPWSRDRLACRTLSRRAFDPPVDFAALRCHD